MGVIQRNTAKTLVSLRLPGDLLARIDAWATDHGLSRTDAVDALVELGLRPASLARASAATRSAKVLGEPGASVVGSAVPVLGTFERKPYQKGAKR